MSTPHRSIITFLLDRSSSMQTCKPATIEAFNAYLAGLQAEADAQIDFTFLQFDTVSLDKLCVGIPVKDARPLTDATYQPRRGTPLIDASVKTIKAVADALTKRDDKPRVVVCIQTDGEENSSRDHTWEELRTLIAAKQAEGWEFNFMGAGIDAYQQGAKMGIAAVNTVSYDSASLESTRSVFRATAENASAFSARRASGTAYSMSQRTAAGDRFAGRLGATLAPTPNPTPAPLDLYSSTRSLSHPAHGPLDLDLSTSG